MNRLLPFFVLSASVVLAQQAPDRLLVQSTRGAKPDAVDRILQQHGAKVQKHINQLGITVLKVDAKQLDKAKKGLDASGLFTFVEQDGIARGSATPNDPGYGSQWHLPKIQAPAAWDVTTGSTATIAIVDSGVDPNHPDLAAKLVPGYSFLTGTNNTSDVLGHGTWVAGSAAAIGNNGNGVSGVSWNNRIMPLVVLNDANFAYYSDIASAITYATDRGVRVINVSIGGSTASSAMQSAIDYAWNKGTLVFASAGNSANSTPNYPASCNNAVGVSATDQNDNLAYFSSYGSTVDISAPGDSIYTTANGSSYGWVAGTSFSSPITAAVAALVLSANPNLSASKVLDILQTSADDLGSAGWDQQFGWGRVNAYRAVTAAVSAQSSDGVAPTAVFSTPGNGSTVSGTVSIQGTASDNVGVTRVDLLLDGSLLTTGTSAQFAFSWDSKAVANGVHALKVIAYDAAGNTGSATISVNVSNTVQQVADSQAPSVQITSPVNNAWVKGNVKISVAASDNVAVRQVSIYIDGVQMWTGSAAPYSYNWNTKKNSGGTHVVSAKAWDAAGNVASTSISVVE